MIIYYLQLFHLPSVLLLILTSGWSRIQPSGLPLHPQLLLSRSRGDILGENAAEVNWSENCNKSTIRYKDFMFIKVIGNDFHDQWRINWNTKWMILEWLRAIAAILKIAIVNWWMYNNRLSFTPSYLRNTLNFQEWLEWSRMIKMITCLHMM